MNIVNIAAIIFGLCMTVVAVFQFALAAGAPWGEAAMCGKFPGRYPPVLRLLAVVTAAIAAIMAIIVLTRSGLVFKTWFPLSCNLIWIVVVISFLSALRNLATPNRPQRRMWAPVGVVLFISSLIVALR